MTFPDGKHQPSADLNIVYCIDNGRNCHEHVNVCYMLNITATEKGVGVFTCCGTLSHQPAHYLVFVATRDH